MAQASYEPETFRPRVLRPAVAPHWLDTEAGAIAISDRSDALMIIMTFDASCE